MAPVFGARHSRRRKWRSPRRSYVLRRVDGGRIMTVARRFPYHFLKGAGQGERGVPLLGVARAISQRPEDRRSIEVRVERQGVRVYAPRSYAVPSNSVAAQSAAAASSEDALTRLLPSAARPLALAISVFAGPDRYQGCRSHQHRCRSVRARGRDGGAAGGCHPGGGSDGAGDRLGPPNVDRHRSIRPPRPRRAGRRDQRAVALGVGPRRVRDPCRRHRRGHGKGRECFLGGDHPAVLPRRSFVVWCDRRHLDPAFRRAGGNDTAYVSSH